LTIEKDLSLGECRGDYITIDCNSISSLPMPSSPTMSR
jgi:hypothetical protein